MQKDKIVRDKKLVISGMLLYLVMPVLLKTAGDILAGNQNRFMRIESSITQYSLTKYTVSVVAILLCSILVMVMQWKLRDTEEKKWMVLIAYAAGLMAILFANNTSGIPDIRMITSYASPIPEILMSIPMYVIVTNIFFRIIGNSEK